jgi:hypothetical protein
LLLEFALSVFSLTFSKQDLIAQLAVVRRDVEGDEVAKRNKLGSDGATEAGLCCRRIPDILSCWIPEGTLRPREMTRPCVRQS